MKHNMSLMDFFIGSNSDFSIALVGSYDWPLVVFSIIVAILGSFSALETSDRIISAKRPVSRYLWLATGAVAVGSAVWGMHFIAMLAFNLPVPVSYSTAITAGSMIPAIIAGGITLFVISREKLSNIQLAVGGVLMGAGIGVMHFTGMLAMQLDAMMHHDPIRFGISIAVAVLLATLALFVKFWANEASAKINVYWKRFGSACIMGLAIAGMHYTAMSGAYFFPVESSGADIVGLDNRYMAVLTGLVVVGIIGFSNFASAFGRHMEIVASLEAEANVRKQQEIELIQHRDRLQELVNEATAELRFKAEELEQALVTEKELSKMQRQFVAMASHEFRTPLAIIDASAQRLLRRADRLTPEDLAKRVDKIRDAVQRMTHLMESTLSAARMEDGKIEVKIDSCDLRRLLPEICIRQRELAKTHTISCELLDMPDTIQADPGAMDQIFTNLLSNAVKYSPAAPDIEVVARRQGEEVVISVRDGGLGIDEEDKAHMFERFFRAKTSAGIIGTGIGLNLVKSLAEMHGGSITMDSTKGEGSTFAVHLPIAGPAQVATPASDAASEVVAEVTSDAAVLEETAEQNAERGAEQSAEQANPEAAAKATEEAA